MNDVGESFNRIAEVIESRKSGIHENSYVAQFFSKGQDEILRKVLEESTEVLLASKSGKEENVIAEIADLWFHLLVLLSFHDLKLHDILEELKSREGISGIEEKQSRKLD